MSTSENEKVVIDAYDAFLRGDLAWLFACLTDDVEWIVPGPAERMPTAGHRCGRDGVAEYVRIVQATYELLSLEPSSILSQGNEVVVVGNWHRRVHATSKLEVSEWVHVFRIRNGRIRRFQAYMDTAAVIEALEP